MVAPYQQSTYLHFKDNLKRLDQQALVDSRDVPGGLDGGGEHICLESLLCKPVHPSRESRQPSEHASDGRGGKRWIQQHWTTPAPYACSLDVNHCDSRTKTLQRCATSDPMWSNGQVRQTKFISVQRDEDIHPTTPALGPKSWPHSTINLYYVKAHSHFGWGYEIRFLQASCDVQYEFRTRGPVPRPMACSKDTDRQRNKCYTDELIDRLIGFCT